MDRRSVYAPRVEIRTREALRIFSRYQLDVALGIREADKLIEDPRIKYLEEAVSGLRWALGTRNGNDNYLFEEAPNGRTDSKAILYVSVPLDRIFGSDNPDRQRAQEFIEWLSIQTSQDISCADPATGSDLGPRWKVVKESVRYLGTAAYVNDGEKRPPIEVRPLHELERETILAALRETKGDKNVAARALEIGKSTLYRRVKDYVTQGFTDFQPYLKE